MTIPSPAQLQQFSDAVRQSPSVLISTHLNPDGDALGSALAMSLYLDSIEVENEVICNNLAPYNLEFLPHKDRIRLTPKKKHELAIVLDLDSLERLGKTRDAIEDCGRMILIDHHIPHQEPGDVRIVDVKAPATALILTRLFFALNAKISPEMATCLLTGIVTDTGSFRYRNTTPESLELCAKLLQFGGDLVQINEEVYQKKPIESVLLLRKVLDNMKVLCDDQLAYSVLPAKDFTDIGAVEMHTEGLVNEMMFIRTTKISALLREPGERKLVRASVRSRGDIDVAAALREFGGGGHKNAAGCTFEMSIEEAEPLLVGALKKCLGY